jgi:hypothetical protein
VNYAKLLEMLLVGRSMYSALGMRKDTCIIVSFNN